MLAWPGFSELCERWKAQSPSDKNLLRDVFDGRMWTTFSDENGQLFFKHENRIGLMLNIDWFNPFERKMYSVGVIFFTVLNLPRLLRYKREKLYALLPQSHFECWRHFVLASRLVSKDEIKLADALFLQFCKKFVTLYGASKVTPNMHLHCHLSTCISDFGPITSFWLFPFERYNGVLGQLPTSNHSIELQVMKRFVEDNSYLQLLHLTPSDSVSERLCTSSGTHYIPSIKYTIHIIGPEMIDDLIISYIAVYPHMATHLKTVGHHIPHTCRRMEREAGTNEAEERIEEEMLHSPEPQTKSYFG